MSEETGLTMDFEYIDLVGSSKDQNPEGPSLEDMCKSLKSGGQVTPWDLFPLLYVAHDPAVAHR
jgi:hypothetical protein